MTEKFLEKKIEVTLIDSLVELEEVLGKVLVGTAWCSVVEDNLLNKVRSVTLHKDKDTISSSLEKLAELFDANLFLDFKTKTVRYKQVEDDNDQNFKNVVDVFDKDIIKHITKDAANENIKKGVETHKEYLELVIKDITESAKKGLNEVDFNVYGKDAALFLAQFLKDKGFLTRTEDVHYTENSLLDIVKYVHLNVEW